MVVHEVLSLILWAAVAQLGDCRTVPLFEPTSVPLTVSAADPVSGSVADGLAVQAGGEINTVTVELEIGAEVDDVHLGPLLPSSGFSVYLVDESTGAAIPVVDGQSLPLEVIATEPGRIAATFFVAGRGGGFARDVPVPLLVLGLTPRAPVDLRIKRWEAYAPDGVEITSVFRVGELCLEPTCDHAETADDFAVTLGISRPGIDDRSILEGFPLLVQAAGQVQAMDTHILYDPRILVPRSVSLEAFFRREGCLTALVPARGEGSILDADDPRIPVDKILLEPGVIFFGLSAVGLCPPPAAAPDEVAPIVKLDFSIGPEVPRVDDVRTQIEVGPGTELFGTDGAPLTTFFDRTATCVAFPGGLCPRDVTCEPTDDLLGAVVSWTSPRLERVYVFRDGLLLESGGGEVRRVIDADPGAGEHTYTVVGDVDGVRCEPRSCSIEIPGIGCPESLACRLINPAGTRIVELSWINKDVYDFLEITAGGQAYPVEPEAQAASIALDGKESVPLEFTLTAGRGAMRCAGIVCNLLPLCVDDFVCSTDGDGGIRLDWGGEAAVTIQRFDPLTGETTVLAEDLRDTTSLIDNTPVGELGARYDLLAFHPVTGAFCGVLSCEYLVPQEGRFTRGDANGSGPLPDISDPISILLYLFTGVVELDCLNAANANGDTALNLGDAVYLLHYLFQGGRPPPAPFGEGECGLEVGTSGGLGCNEYAPCGIDGSFPENLECSVDGTGTRVFVTWTPGQPGAGEDMRQSIRLGHRPPVELSPVDSQFEFVLEPGEGGEIPVFLTASIGDVSRALSCVVTTPEAVRCPGSLRCELDRGSESILTSWDVLSGIVDLRIVKDSGLEIVLEADVTSAAVPLEAGDMGRVVTLRLEAQGPAGDTCIETCQVGVPDFECPRDLACSLDMARNVVLLEWTAGRGLESTSLVLQKAGAVPVLLDTDTSSAEVPLSEADLGSSVDIFLTAPDDSCDPLTCRVDVPAEPVNCPDQFTCDVVADVVGATGIIRLSWSGGSGLDALHVLRDGNTEFVLPADAEMVNLVLDRQDFGTDIIVSLQGFAAGIPVCQTDCIAPVPPLVVCPTDLSCSFDASIDSITASWTPAEGLLSLAILKDGVLADTLPPSATFADVLLGPEDFDRDVTLNLQGTTVDGLIACSLECAVPVPPRPPVKTPFVRGDCNGDGIVSEDFADIDFIDLVVQGLEIPPCANACDANDDGFIEPDDAVFLMEFLFQSGPPLPAPYPGCGADETPDDLDCGSYPACE